MPHSDPDNVARETLRLIGPDPQNWVPDRDGIDHNVVVIGGGQSMHGRSGGRPSMPRLNS